MFVKDLSFTSAHEKPVGETIEASNNPNRYFVLSPVML
jgi:hypothetical protein